MDWLAVFAAAGGAAAFAQAAKYVAEKVVEQVMDSRRATKLERAKVAYLKSAEHQEFISRTQLDVLGELLDAIYPLKSALARVNLSSPRLNWNEIDLVIVRMRGAIEGLEANLGGKRPYIPPGFDRRVHAFKNDLIGLRADLSERLHSVRGRKHLPERQSIHVRECLTTLGGVIDDLFGSLVQEAQRRVVGNGPD